RHMRDASDALVERMRSDASGD
ncbi:MAG: hypothetical protein JWR00_1327, partial [Rubritepida sp.]|nr:hypothetical protein [Rubritepida sp.]